MLSQLSAVVVVVIISGEMVILARDERLNQLSVR